MPVSRTRGVRRLLLVTLSAAAAAAPAAGATMRAFVTSATCTGDFGSCTAAVGDTGVAAGNNICQSLANAAGLDTNGEIFRAWVSDAGADAWCNVLGLAGQRFGSPACGVGTLPAGGPWMRLDGVPYLQSLATLMTDGGTVTTIPITESNAYVPNSFFYAGSTASGTVGGSNCNNWTDGTVNFNASGGNTDSVGGGWGTGAAVNCDGARRLLCFEVGAGDPLVYPTVPGALVFVTSTRGSGDLSTWPGSGGADGLAGGDAVCQSLAAAAFLPFPESFVAFLSDGATDAVSRLTLNGPWKREDGVLIADSLADLTDGALDDAIAYTENGGRFTDDAWTGTTEAGVSTPENCVGWTSGLSADTGARGRPWRSENTWTGVTALACNTNLHLFCFSNQLLLGWDHFESGDFRRWPEVVGLAP